MNAGAFQVFDCELDGTRLIEASAGTGKTWNLCALYLRLLLERDLKVADILVVTFTNAATAELRERIRSRIAETLARLRGTAPPSADPFVGELLERLRGSIEHKTLDTRLELALQSFDEASILTIHGFCQRALAEAPFSTGMPMQLTLLADDSEMRLDVVHDFWRRRIAGAQLPPALAAHLLEHKFTPPRLAELLARRLGKPLARLRWPQALDAPVAAPDDAALAAAFNAARTLWRADREEIIAILREAQPRLHKSPLRRRPAAAGAAVLGPPAGRERRCPTRWPAWTSWTCWAARGCGRTRAWRRRRHMTSLARRRRCWICWPRAARRWSCSACSCCASCSTKARRRCAAPSATSACWPSTTCSSTCTSAWRPPMARCWRAACGSVLPPR